MTDETNGKGEDGGKLLYCSFCGKSQHEVRKLIAGPSVFICDECVDLCNTSSVKKYKRQHRLMIKIGCLHRRKSAKHWVIMLLAKLAPRKCWLLLFIITTNAFAIVA
jgi:hypothetical protein